MEKLGINLDKTTVITALSEGRKHANELKRQLNPTIISSQDCGPLLDKILSSYDNAISLLCFLGNGDSSQSVLESPSPISIAGSPRSEGSDPDSKGQALKKRKTSPKWKEQVRVCSGEGSDGLIGDGYNWRKYGQKDILGAKYPRAYYRCTHRHTQGCLATKQVQRTDEDPSIFEVIYRGKHTCIQERLKQNKADSPNAGQDTPKHSNEIPVSPETPVLENENQEFETKVEKFPSFSFRTDPIESDKIVTGFFSEHGNIAGTGYSPFVSPATSDSYFSLSPCHVNDFGFANNFPSSESDLSEIMSNPTTLPNYYMFGELDFDSCFMESF